MKKFLSTLAQLHNEVLAFLTRNSLKFAGNQPLIDATASLTTRVGEEERLAREITMDISGIADGKKSARKRMAQLADAMRKRVQSACMGNNDPVGYKNANITYSSMVNGKILVCMSRAQIVHDLANALSSADKTKYQVTTADLTELQNQIDLVKDLNTERRSAVVIRSTNGELLTEVTLETAKFIRDTVDKLMGNYQVKDAPMYKEYLKSRVPENAPGRHAEITGTVMIAGTDTPLPRVKVIASNGIKTFEDMTDVKGKYKMPVSPELYNLTFELPDYVAKEVQNVLVDSAEKQTVSVKLEKAN